MRHPGRPDPITALLRLGSYTAFIAAIVICVLYFADHPSRLPIRITITYVAPTPTPMPLNATSPTPYLQCCPAEPEWGAQAAQQMQALRQRHTP